MPVLYLYLRWKYLTDNCCRTLSMMASFIPCCTAVGPSDHTTPAHGGKRSHSAYDVPESAASVVVQGGYDGFDLPKQALYQGLFELLQRIKPAGAAAIIELEGE